MTGAGTAAGGLATRQHAPAKAKQPAATARPRPMQVIVKAKRKAENGAANGAAHPEAKKQETSVAAQGSPANSGEGLGGLVGYGSSDEAESK